MNEIIQTPGIREEEAAPEKLALPLPSVPCLDGDSLDLEKLDKADLLTYIKYDGIEIGDELWPQFFGRGSLGEVVDRERTPLVIQKLEEDGSFQVALRNNLLVRLDQGIAFYSYARTVGTGEGQGGRRLQDQSPRLLFYVNKQAPLSEQLPVPHFKDSDGLVVDRARVTGNGTVVVGAYPAMAVGDTVKLTWKDAYMSETFSKVVTPEDLGNPLAWVIDSSYLEMAGGWCEISCSIGYADSDSVSRSPTQHLTLLTGNPAQLPSLPPPDVENDSGEHLDPSEFPDGLMVEVADYGMQYADEVLLHASGTATHRASLRVERTVLDSGRLRFVIAPQWLQDNIGKTVSLTYQWARAGAAADSAALELTLRKPLDLKLPVIDEVTPKDPEPPELPDPDIEQYGFISPFKLFLGAYVEVPREAQTSGGKLTMYWDGYGERGQYSTREPVFGNNLRYHIPPAAVPANLGKRLKVYYTVEMPEKAPQRSPVYGLRIEDLPSSSFESIQCPDAPNGRLSLQGVKDAVRFILTSNSWRFFDQGQIVRVYITGKGKPEYAPLPPEVIRDNVPVSEDEWNEGELVMRLSRAYLDKLELNNAFEVYVEVSFDGGDNFKSIAPADIQLVA
ncbi:hypothetical protein G7009_27150 [Pseudomonas capeferrum]|uniref:hypothetical protein n=1 Tax=Pseudomonas capeferrum TaxID=1495066 RepID=UPI0015E3E06C|nr:hypothetical protein [Pseudomonas capeferrum]MBA1205388.1 hypothetical protein [Pseudomonas capeferrum]